ncbi:MAG: YeiH family protein, partial [Bacteroidia bacterium]|nr:YeiH family protein [Bacteroidia bacterium]
MTKSSLLTKDDYWSIWLGAFLLLLGLVAFLSNRSGDLSRQMTEQDLIMQEESRKAPFETIAWHEALEKKNTVKASSLPIGLFLKKLTTKPSTWNSNPLVAFVTTKQQADRAKDESKEAYISLVAQVTAARNQALASQNLAAQDSYQNDQYNNAAVAAIGQWQESKQALEKVQKKQSTKAANKIPWLITLMLVLGLLFGIGMTFMETSFFTFLKGFAFVSLIGLIAYTLAAQADMKAIGFGYAAWAIIIGLLISNTIGTPQWVQPALSTEFYIKTGLVILGAEILLGKILAIGLPGIFVAWVVTPIVLITTYWFGQKVLKIGSKTLNMTISADMSVCGVSAAVATAAACKATKEELTVAIGLSMIFTSVMMIVLPAFINWVGIPEILGGAWIGGTIDATGAVVAAGAFLGEKALSVAATIKMIQNVLIGL